MRKILSTLIIMIAFQTGYGQLSNNAFNLANDYGDFRMRRYIAGDLTWKRALVSGSTMLLVNYGGDFSDGTRIMGSKLLIDGQVNILNDNGLQIDDSTTGFAGTIKMSDGFTNLTTKDDLLFESDGAFLFKLDRNGNGISNIPGFGVFDKNNNGLFLVKDNGNVGIGTTAPDAKLAVNGNIHTKEVKVDLIGWADYVFKDSYNLPTLKQVENHIAKKGHLINIPSAAEVAENGIQLGAMNAKLLEKIEELTLYTISQEKKLKEQEKINNQLKTNNQNLEARLAKVETLLGKE